MWLLCEMLERDVLLQFVLALEGRLTAHVITRKRPLVAVSCRHVTSQVLALVELLSAHVTAVRASVCVKQPVTTQCVLVGKLRTALKSRNVCSFTSRTMYGSSFTP